MENSKTNESPQFVLKATLKTFDESSKSVWSILFWYVKVCIFWKCIQYTIYCSKTKILKKIPLGQNKWYKNFPSFFFLRAPTYHNLTFNLQFLFELKNKVRLSKTARGIFHFRFCFLFIDFYIFVQQNSWTL